MVVSVVASRLACEVCYVYRSAMTVSPSVVVLCFTLSTALQERNVYNRRCQSAEPDALLLILAPTGCSKTLS